MKYFILCGKTISRYSILLWYLHLLLYGYNQSSFPLPVYLRLPGLPYLANHPWLCLVGCCATRQAGRTFALYTMSFLTTTSATSWRPFPEAISLFSISNTCSPSLSGHSGQILDSPTFTWVERILEEHTSDNSPTLSKTALSYCIQSFRIVSLKEIVCTAAESPVFETPQKNVT